MVFWMYKGREVVLSCAAFWAYEFLNSEKSMKMTKVYFCSISLQSITMAKRELSLYVSEFKLVFAFDVCLLLGSWRFY